MERPGDLSTEALASEMKRMSVQAPAPKPTGYVYHEDMLKHALSLDDEKIAKSHVENPYRLKTIIERFKKNGLEAACETVTDFPECSKDLVKAVHPEPYFDYVDNLVPNDPSRKTADVGNYHPRKMACGAATPTQ